MLRSRFLQPEVAKIASWIKPAFGENGTSWWIVFWQVIMGYKKYVNDYSKEYVIKPNGKPGVIAVYKGK